MNVRPRAEQRSHRRWRHARPLSKDIPVAWLANRLVRDRLPQNKCSQEAVWRFHPLMSDLPAPGSPDRNRCNDERLAESVFRDRSAVLHKTLRRDRGQRLVELLGIACQPFVSFPPGVDLYASLGSVVFQPLPLATCCLSKLRSCACANSSSEVLLGKAPLVCISYG